jgi:hypothetical protein
VRHGGRHFEMMQWMPATRPCPNCGQPTSPITGLCEFCGQPQGAAPPSHEHAAPAQPQPQPQPQHQPQRQSSSQGQPSNAGVLWAEVSGFLEIFALFAPIAVGVVLIAMGIANMLILLPAFLISVGIGAFNWRER